MFLLQITINPNPQPDNFDPNPNPDPNPLGQPDDNLNPNNHDHGVGGGAAANVRNLNIRTDGFVGFVDSFGLQSQTGRTSAYVTVVGGTAYATRNPYATVASVAVVPAVDIYTDCRRVNNHPEAADVVENALASYMTAGVLTQEQVNRIRTMANSANFNRDTFRDLLVGMGIPLESATNAAGVVTPGANALADAARNNRTAGEIARSNRNTNITATAIGAGAGILAGVAIVAAVNCWNPFGWVLGGALAIAAVVVTAVVVCAAVGNWIGGWFRR